MPGIASDNKIIVVRTAEAAEKVETEQALAATAKIEFLKAEITPTAFKKIYSVNRTPFRDGVSVFRKK